MFWMMIQRSQSGCETGGFSMTEGVPSASTRRPGETATATDGAYITSAQRMPLANSSPPTRRQRPEGRSPSGNSHSSPAMKTIPIAHPGWNAIATRPRGSAPWCRW